MKTLIFAASLFGVTAAGVTYFDELVAATRSDAPVQRVAAPVKPSDVVIDTTDRPQIDLVFALDTTGSMSGLIQAAKNNIWSIASSMANAKNPPIIRVGLVGYRDRGDVYVTKTFDLTEDLDAMYTQLMSFRANGGGDSPESVNKALHDAVTGMNWSQSDDTYKVVFLVGDAPPHMDYANEMQYPEIVRLASSKGIVVNTILCGTNRPARKNWKKIASLSQGQFFQVGQTGNAVAMQTPYDKKMAELSRKLDKTRMVYGKRKERERINLKQLAESESVSKASVSSRARRADFNVTDSGRRNAVGEKDLVGAVVSGKVALDSIKNDELPEALQAMSPKAAKEAIENLAKDRRELRDQIKTLASKRQNFIKQELKSKGGAADSLDEKIYSAVQAQAKEKGIVYEKGGARY
jgi:hypothetical protein